MNEDVIPQQPSNQAVIDYELQSWRGKKVSVPREYAKIAEEIVDNAMIQKEGNKMSDETAKMFYDLSRNIGIRSVYERLERFAANDFGQSQLSPETLRYQDQLYLRICINLNEQRMQSPEREAAQVVDRNLIDAIHAIK